MPDRVFIGIGTNLGDRAANYREAITRIAGLPDTRVIRQSSVYETEPVGDAAESMGPFLNGVIEIQTELRAESLMDRDRKSTRLNSSHTVISYAVFCLKKKKNQ